MKSSGPFYRGILPAILAGLLGASGAAGSPDGALAEAPLAPRSGPRGATMFTLLKPEQTGIVTDNRYDDPKMWGEHYQELAYGAMGTGVAIGDYDNDGRPDIFVVSKTGRCRLFRNLGDWKFEDVTEQAGLGDGALKEGTEAWRQGAVFADVNNDGWLDLYICRFNAPNLLYMNQGNGTFKEEAVARGLAVTDASGVGAFCDYDRDGWLDVYITTNMLDAARHPNGQRGYLLHNNGDGTFSNVTEKAGIFGESLSHSATWWDYDGDGWPDLYVGHDYATPDRLYHNNRDGTFTDVINQVVPHMPYYSMGSDLGDINNDGRIDFFVADMAASTHEKDQRGMAYSRARAQLPPSDPSAAPQYMRNALYLDTGTGRCLEAAYLAGVAATDWTWSPRFEDLDNDGRLDLFVTNGMSREYHNIDLLDRIMAVENPADAKRVIRSSPKLTEANLAFRNEGDLHFANIGAAWGLNQRGVSFGSAFGDLDGDGDLDLVFANYESGVTVLRNDSDTGHRLIVALRGTKSNRFGVGATVRVESASGPQVRTLVVARGYLSSSEPVLHFGLGEDAGITRLTVNWPSGQTQTFTHLPVDRKLTITEPEASPRTKDQGQGSGTKDSQPAKTQFAEVKPAPVAPAPAFPPPIKSGDLVAAADFDRDGRLDYFVASPAPYPLPSHGTLFAGRDGNLEDVTDALAPTLRDAGLVTAALWSDVDGDGWSDLLLALDWGPVKYFHNRAGRGFEDWTEQSGFATAGTGRWSALAAADFNGDGRPDYVAGNLGLNTRYQASAEFPVLLFHGNFGAGAPATIEAYYENGRLYPWLTRNELAAKIPAVLRRFPRNDAYARAALGEILGEDQMARARRFASTELRSGVFLSGPDGTFHFVPLPRIAQIAPLRGIVAGDFDGDGRADIYAVQNSFAPPPSVGRFDGGVSQLLRGDGRGQFIPVAPAESGLVVPGEATSVTALDLNADGWPDFLVARDQAAALAYRNQGVPGHHSLCVRLHGAAGNPAAIGARVQLELADGTIQTAEVQSHAQSPSDVFFGYPDANLPRRLLLRWPDGVASEHPVPPDTKSLSLGHP
jgi:hypothetical protein